MKANNGYRKPTGAELRAQRIAREVQASPAEEARRHEKLMLSSFVAATASLEWLGTHEGWKLLGFDTCAEWWGARVQPVVEALGLAPTKELGQKVIGLIRAEEAALPRAQQRSARELAALVGVSEWTVRTPTPRSSSARNHERADLDETSAAGPAANPEGDSPVLGGQDGAATDLTEGGAHGRGLSDPEDSPAAELIEPSHAGVPAVGDQIEERDEEEAVEASADLPAAATTSLPDGDGNPMPEQSQQPGQDSPTGVEGPRSETDSPTGLEAAQPRDDRSETSHHAPAGVSGVGEAPEEPRPSVEPVGLEDGDGSPASSSSSDPDVAGNPAERLLLAVAGLVHYLDQVDVDAVGPLLLGPDVEQLFDHAEEISAHITRIGKARFAEMLTP